MPKTIKCLLRSFLTQEGQELLLPRIAEAVPIMNKLVTETYHLMNLHFRRMLEADPAWIPNMIFDQEYVLNFMRVLHETTDYAPETDILETKTLLYDPLRVAAGLDTLVHPFPSSLVQVKKYAAIEIATNIRNNIAVHFCARLRKFVAFAHPELTPAERHTLVHSWWEVSHSDQHPRLFPPPGFLVGPKNQPVSVEYTLQAAPEVFIPSMWYMLQTYEVYNSTGPRKPKKLFGLLPVRRGFCAHHIRIDSQTIDAWTTKSPAQKEYLIAKKERLRQANLQKEDKTRKRPSRDKSITAAERDVLWEPLIRKRALRGLGRFLFAYSFSTNGHDVSIFCEESFEQKGKKRRPFSKTVAEPFPQDDRKVVGIDPGKHSILYMTSDSSKPGPAPEKFERMEYTCRRRRHDMHVNQFAKIRSSRKEAFFLQTDVDIQELETLLSIENHKCPSLAGFSDYLRRRFAHQEELYLFYDDSIFPKLKFKSFQGRQKSERQLVQDVERVFGPKDSIVLAFGDWSESTQMKGCVSSPTVGIRNKLAKHFCVRVVSEYNTTQTCSKCGGLMKPVPERACRIVNPKTGVVKLEENRALRRCQNVECGALFSRDYNAAINIRRQALHLRQHQGPHPWFAKPEATQAAPPENLI